MTESVPPQPDQPSKRQILKVIGGGFALLLAYGIGHATASTSASYTAAVPAASEAAGITDGTYVVGTDIQPGTYHTVGPYQRALPNCYWARLSGTSGELADIITSDNTKGPATVTIRSSDKAFRTSGCVAWQKTG